MSAMPRQSILTSYMPLHDRLPIPGVGLWYPLHGSLASGISGYASAVEKTVGSANAAKWDTLGEYAMPTDNGNTNRVAIAVEHAEDNDFINSVVGLDAASVGTQIIYGMELKFGDQQTDPGTFFSYGVYDPSGKYSMFALWSSITQVLQVAYMGVGASEVTVSPLTLSSGTSLDTMRATGSRFSLAASVYLTGAMTATLDVLIFNATLLGTYTLPLTFSAYGGTKPPGRNNATATQHRGLVLGARGMPVSGDSTDDYDRYLGRGSGHSASIGNFMARKFSSYSADRLTAVMNEMRARPSDYVPSLL